MQLKLENRVTSCAATSLLREVAALSCLIVVTDGARATSD